MGGRREGGVQCGGGGEGGQGEKGRRGGGGQKVGERPGRRVGVRK